MGVERSSLAGGTPPHANPGAPPDGAPRLTAEMSSRKLIALEFIKSYFARWGHSPTLGELAAHLRVSRKRAYDLVHQLSDEQMIAVEAGKTRGIRLIERGEELSETDVLLLLVARGWTLGKGARMIEPPGVPVCAPRSPPHTNPDDRGAEVPLTTKGLSGGLDLDFDPGDAAGAPGLACGGAPAADAITGGESNGEAGQTTARG